MVLNCNKKSKNLCLILMVTFITYMQIIGIYSLSPVLLCFYCQMSQMAANTTKNWQANDKAYHNSMMCDFILNK